MIKKLIKRAGIGSGLAVIAKKELEKHVKKLIKSRSIQEKEAMIMINKVGAEVKKEGKKIEEFLIAELKKEAKKAKPYLKKAKPYIKKVKDKAKKKIKGMG